MEQITLYYREGTSDKVYQASLQPKEDGYVVQFAYGRRGATLATGTKTQHPVDYPSAKSIYDRLVREKTAKGYTPGEDGTAYQDSNNAKRSAGILPQLLNPVEQQRVQELIEDPAYWMQEKMDGRRLLVQKQGREVTGINRLGLVVSLPATLVENALASPDDFLIDGEGIGDDLHAFDLLFLGGEDMRPLGYGERYLKLMNLLASFQHPHLPLVENQFRPKEKQREFQRLREQGREGVVFKHIDAPYTAGRPSSGGTQHKFKFHETASFIVTKMNAKRSVMLVLYDGGRIVNAGNVTIPPNHEVPEPGSVVECRYLYAFRESGCIYQPVYLGVRDDIPSGDCTTDQLKFKPALAAA